MYKNPPLQNVQTFRHALPSQAHDRDSIISTRESGEADGAMTPTGRAVMPGHRSMSEHRRSVLSAEREIASLDGYARDSCPGCGACASGGAVLMTTAYEGGTARPAERPSRPRWAPSPGVQALRVRLARVPAAGALLRGRRRDEYSVQQLTCSVCSIRKEGVHDGSLGRRACVQQVSPPPADLSLIHI